MWAKVVKGENPRKQWTVRWQDPSGKLHEKSFYTRAEANDHRARLDNEMRSQAYVDPGAGKELFGEAAGRWLASRPLAPSSRAAYTAVYRTHVGPVLGSRTLASVAQDRDGVTELLTRDLAHLSHTRRTKARLVITGVLDEAVRSGKLASHRLGGIGLRDDGPGERSDFVFPSYDQVEQLAGALRHGLAVWLMRATGLRVAEALAVELGDFRDGGQTLRVSRQATRDGKGTMPLKHRRATEFRDVPCPAWLWDMVRGLPDGPLLAEADGRLPRYGVFNESFARHARNAGIPAGFTPHSLRHAFVSALLARGVPVTDVAAWLGHRDIAVTYSTYAHLIPSAAPRAAAALDQEYQEWRESDLQTVKDRMAGSAL